MAEQSNKGLVYKSTGSWYNMRDAQGRMIQARLKGKLKIDEEISSSNPIAVGDYVLYDMEEDDSAAVIRAVSPRENYIVRVSPQNRHQKHIVASNLDLALVMATIASPRTSNGFIDRFLVTAEAYHIPAVIVINKVDLLTKDKHIAQLHEWKKMYGAAGYQLYAISALDDASILPLKTLLKDKRTLFSGHSGVGKSTLINRLMPGKEIRTQEVSDWSGKGQHTTTFAEMHDLPGGGQIIDTPGVKEFGLIDFEKEELAQYFPEMRALMPHCKFNNCLHKDEPGCAVKDALNAGLLSIDRYVSYLTIMDTVEKKW